MARFSKGTGLGGPPRTAVSKFTGEHLDVHNSNYSTITMKELHMLDLTITKKYFNYDLGVNISNVLDEEYESPHGFSQEGIGFNFVIKSNF